MNGGGFFSRIGNALHQPSQGMTWTQLAAAVIFVTVVLVAWRQVIKWGMGEL